MENLFNFSADGFLSLYYSPQNLMLFSELPEELPYSDLFKGWLCKDDEDNVKTSVIRSFRNEENKVLTRTYSLFPLDLTHKKLIIQNKCNFFESIYLDTKGNAWVNVILQNTGEKKLRSNFVINGKFDKVAFEHFVKVSGKNPENLYLKYSTFSTISLSKLLAIFISKGSLIEELVKLITAKLLEKTSNLEENPYIKEVSGSAIPYFYNQKNYSKTGGEGNLWDSCMRGEEASFRTEFYAMNEGVISLLVLFDKKYPTKIRARAVLWKTIHNTQVVDRIYYINENDTKEMKKWLIKRGIKSIYSRRSTEASGIDKEVSQKAIVQLHPKVKEIDFQLPYLDSMAVNLEFGYACPDYEELLKFLEKEFSSVFNKLKLSVTTIPPIQTFEEPDKNTLVFINKPKPRYTSLGNCVYLATPTDCYLADKAQINEINLKYNNFVEVKGLLLGPGNNHNRDLILKDLIADKQYVVYSRLLQTKILKDKNVVWSSRFKSYIYRDLLYNYTFLKRRKLLLLKRMYSHRVVKLNDKGKNFVDNLYSNLPVKISTSMFRMSRKYCIKPESIKETGILIHGVLIPFNCLTVVKFANGKSKK